MSARTETVSDLITETIRSALCGDYGSASDDTLFHLARALDTALHDESEALSSVDAFPSSPEHAHHVYRAAYEGVHGRGLAEAREVIAPDWLEGRSIETMHRVARMKRERDDLSLAFARATGAR
jgi:hypothetical protein